jgi:hypothetical protein
VGPDPGGLDRRPGARQVLATEPLGHALTGGPFDHDTIVVSEGFNALARALTRTKAGEQTFEVWDANGTQIGVVEPADRDSAAAKGFRLLFALVFTSSTRRNNRRLRLVDMSGATLLQLHIAHSELRVSGPGGEELGEVRNVSRVRGDLAAEFVTDAPVARASTPLDNPPYELAIIDAAGASLGRLVNEGDRRNRLELYSRPEPRLHALLVAFACGLVDRVWFYKPQASGYGGA